MTQRTDDLPARLCALEDRMAALIAALAARGALTDGDLVALRLHAPTPSRIVVKR